MKTNIPVTMKRLIILSILLSFMLKASSQDLPGSPSNIQSLPIGSYVIPMDNTNQLNTAGLFNLKSYGLVVYMLNQNVKIKWVITAGKAKDAIDFTVTSDKIKPTSTATGLSRNFKAGPFVIFQQDTAGVAAICDAYYITNGLAGNNRPTMYVTRAAVNVDVRYDLTGQIPKAAILNDGGKQSIHTGFMTDAGIPAINYSISAGDNLTNCFTFASEPHNDKSGPLVDSAIVHIKQFVQTGGNFLAECAAIINYENNVLGRFQTTTGITNTTGGGYTGMTYSNADLSFSQFEGQFDGDLAGSVRNWSVNAAGINNEHNYVKGTGASSASLSASVSKLKTGMGGLVFYLGNHDFTTSDVQNINGIRMYMNAFLTPATTMCALPLSLISFSGSLKNSSTQFQWTVGENETGDHFELQASADGKNFSTFTNISTTSKQGLESYTYVGNEISGTTFYRLKMVNKTYSIIYSKVILLKDKNDKGDEGITVLENPVRESLTFSYATNKSGLREVSIYNMVGVKVYHNQVNAQAGTNSFSLPLGNSMSKGIYFVQVTNGTKINQTKIVKL